MILTLNTTNNEIIQHEKNLLLYATSFDKT